MVTIESLEKSLKAGNLQSLYLLYGEELFLLENSLRRIKKLFTINIGECVKGINYISIDENNYGEIIQDIETPSFGYSKKLIIARNTGLLKKDGKRKNADLQKIRDRLSIYIKENINQIKESIVLIFIEEDADTKLELYKTLEKSGIVCKFDYQKPFQIEKRVAVICKSYGVQIDNQTLKYFIECVGTSMQDVINEIRKLIEYAGSGGKIEKKDIDALTIRKLESIIFDLTDSLGKRDIKTALEVLNNLVYNREPLQKILVTLYNHFKKIYFTRIAVEKNKDVIQSLQLKPNQTFLVNKYKMQARYFKNKDLEKILQSLRDLDYNSKNGLIDLQIGLETIICSC